MSTVKGNIEVSVNEAKTRASLIFTPQTSSKDWELKDILDLLEKSNVTYGVDQDSILAALQEFEAAKLKTCSHPVAKGLDPEPHSHGEFSLVTKELEPSLKNTMYLVVKKAGPPHFLESLDQKITNASFFEKDEIIGSFSESRKGQEGISVFGDKLTIPVSENQNKLLIGPGIRKNSEGDLVAEKTGFVRRGTDWVELIPFKQHMWEICSSKNGATFFLEFTPGMRSLKAPKGDQILKEVRELSAEENFIGPEEIEQFIKDIIDKQEPGKIALIKREESQISLKTDSLNIKAELVLIKSRGYETPLSLKAVSKLLNESGLKKMDPVKIKKEIMDFYNSSEREIRLLLCEGVPPQRAKERTLNFSVPFLDQSYLELLIDKVELDDTLISRYRSIKDFPIEQIEKLAMVNKGQTIFSLSSDVKGKDGVDVFGKPISGLNGNDPSLKLYENIEFQKGAAKAAISGILEVREDKENHVYYARIREHANAPIHVNIAKNKMTASITIGLPSGTGFAADKQMIKETLEKAGVVEGYLEEKIDEAAETSGLGEVLTDMVVAEGKYPLGGNKELKLLHDIEYRDKNKNFVPMKSGEKIGLLLVSGEDSEGYTVTGEALLMELDNNDIEIGANIRQVETDELDQFELIAARSGRLIFTGNKLFIQDTILIEGDLSPHMGKVEFPGNVMINGTVLSKAVVHAGENINIAGVVQAALVSAGGFVKIEKGIKGSQKAVLRGRAFEFEYAEEANIMALERIKCHKTMMRCQVRCNGSMETGERGTRIVGGEIKVRDGLSAETIGNERGIETAIHFGQDYLIEDQIAQLMKDLEKIQLQIIRIDEIIEKARGRADKQDVMMKARNKKVRILKAMEKKNVKLFLQREKFEEHFESSIRVSGNLNEGTTFHSHGRSLTIFTQKKSVEIYFSRENGQICERPIN